jgi:hypothetical protein
MGQPGHFWTGGFEEEGQLEEFRKGVSVQRGLESGSREIAIVRSSLTRKYLVTENTSVCVCVCICNSDLKKVWKLDMAL